MVRITKITYGKTFNIGNYEAKHIRLEAELMPMDDTIERINEIYETLVAGVERLNEVA